MADEAIIRIRRKLREQGVKVASIVSKCEVLDRNRDNIIHVDDLEEVIQECLKDNPLTRREMNYLLGRITHDKRRGNVEYSQLFEILEQRENKVEKEEVWHDDEACDDDVESAEKGSIGEFLQRSACPAEVKNFKRFIAALEMFERDSGMRVTSIDGGFLVPLGPDLRASVKFFTA